MFHDSAIQNLYSRTVSATGPTYFNRAVHFYLSSSIRAYRRTKGSEGVSALRTFLEYYPTTVPRCWHSEGTITQQTTAIAK